MVLAIVKPFSQLGSIIMILISLITTVLTVFSLINSHVFFGVKAEIARDVFFTALIVINILTFLAALSGIFGIQKKKIVLVIIYQISMIIFVIFFGALAVAAEVFPQRAFQGNCTVSQNQLVEKAANIFSLADDALCKQFCPCGMTSEARAQYNLEDQKILDDNQTYYFKGGAANSTQQCEAASDWDEEILEKIQRLRSLEEIFQCSDWCQQGSQESLNLNLFFKFSNVNDGKPGRRCYPALKGALFEFATIVKWASLGVAITLVVVISCNCILFCHPEQRKKQLLQRLMHVRNFETTYGSLLD